MSRNVWLCMPAVYVYVGCCWLCYIYMSLIYGEYLVNVHSSDIPHTFIPHFTLHSAEKIRIKFSTNYPLTTFRIPQSAFRKIPLPSKLHSSCSGFRYRSVYSHDRRMRSALCRLFSRQPVTQLKTSHVACQRLLLVATLTWYSCWHNLKMALALNLHDKFDNWQKFKDKLDAYSAESYQT